MSEESCISSPLMVNASNSSERREAAGDPYYSYRDDLKEKMLKIAQQYDKWKLLSTRSSAGQDFYDSTKSLEQDLKVAEQSLNFLDNTVTMVQTRPSQFKHIDSAELKERQYFVSSTRESIQTMIQALSCDSIRSRLKTVERKKLQRLNNVPKSKEEWDKDNTTFIQSEQQRQEELLTEQDENLDQLGISVVQLGQVAIGINHEIDSQNKMLDEMNHDVDQTQERMNFVMGRMSKLLKTKDRCQLGSIIILTIILVVMVFLVLYT